MSVRFQLTMPEDLAERLKQAAERQRIPLAEFIRETMEERLRAMDGSENSQDPFASVRGLVDSPETDLASRVDEILYRHDPLHRNDSETRPVD
ncbi:MAG: ribbon-helix-helix domain-containing protein [bacterium]|nr:ribbon-helix-helix domain-containing protein [bacterium]